MKTTKINNLRKAALATVATAALVAGTAACGGKNDSTSESSSNEAAVAVEAPAAGATVAEATTGSTRQPAESSTGSSAVEATGTTGAAEVTSTEDASAPAEASATSGTESGSTESGSTESGSTESGSTESGSTESGSTSGSGHSSGGRLGGIIVPPLHTGAGKPGVGDMSNVDDLVIDPSDVDMGELEALTQAPAEIAFVIFSGSDGSIKVSVAVNEGGFGDNDIVSVNVSYSRFGMRITKSATLVDDEITQSTWATGNLPVNVGQEVTIKVTDEAGNVTTQTAVVTVIVM